MSVEQHGTTADYRAGCRCDQCRAANTRYSNYRRWDILNGVERRVNVTPTRRRVQALHCLGWTLEAIAEAAGYRSLQAINRALSRQRITPTTAERIATAYEALSMTVGPSDAARRRAQRLGFAPPLAWDDIDTDLEPRGTGYRSVHKRSNDEMTAEAAHLLGLGVSIHQAAKQLGVTVAAIEKATERAKGRVA